MHEVTLKLAKSNSVIVARINKVEQKKCDDDELTRGKKRILRHRIRILNYGT